MTTERTRRGKSKFVQVYLTNAESELLEQMSLDSGMSKTEFMRQMFLQYGDTFRNRQNASEPLQLATA